ncbi:MAG: L-lactate permease [Candidatus Pacearchaeota archaeon]|nr:L-lactate permease [Candidatus Pacearchaeota archaeon]
MNLILTLVALIPFVLLFFLIVIRKVPALKSMPLIWLLTVAITLALWKISVENFAASFLKAFFMTTEIMLIIFGAVLLIEVLKQKRQVEVIQKLMSSISPDARIQAIIIAWFFGALIEGIAGFGTPAALAAPLLVSIGFSPLLAVTTALISNSIPVSFGAAGTPILIGLAPLNLSGTEIGQITNLTAVFNSIAGLVIPIALVCLVIANSREKKRFSGFVKTIPFILFSWIVFIVPYYLVAHFVGPELPSIITGLFGLVIISLAAHYRILTPKRAIVFKRVSQKTPEFWKVMKSILPYLLIIAFLALTRIIPLIKTSLSSINLSWNNIFNTGISYSFLPFYTPSFYFILSVIICFFIYKATGKDISISIKGAFSRIKIPFIALLFTIAFVQLLISSSNNASGIEGIPALLAESISLVSKGAYILISPFIGAFGAFIAGSNTVSNLLFGLLQSTTAKALGLSAILIISLQVAGGAVGNMIAIHNVIAANSVVGLKDSEGKVIRKTIIIAIIYSLALGILGLILSGIIL